MTERLEVEVSNESFYNLGSIINYLRKLSQETSIKERTKVILDTPDSHIIVSAYLPGQGEELHSHPTQNTLLILFGNFEVFMVDEQGKEAGKRCGPLDLITLNRNQPHRVKAISDQEDNAVIMVSIVEGMSTSDPDYSTPVVL